MAVTREVVVGRDQLRLHVEVLEDHAKFTAKFKNLWLAEQDDEESSADTEQEYLEDLCARCVRDNFPPDVLHLLPDEVWVKILLLRAEDTETYVEGAIVYFLAVDSC